MPHIIVKKPFKFAHEGIRVQEFEPSTEAVEVSDECAAVALEEGWAKVPGERSKRAIPEAPENKDRSAGSEEQAPADPTASDSAVA